ncbi:MAG: hypothetical protein Q8R39_00825 [bacterium]|nr:hypothetical protein [bacterium]MDZ4284950.1 hypothetical protein [Patescibacteria group bacterium]
MTINWKIWAPLGIIVLVALVAIGFSKSEVPQAPVTGEPRQAPVVREESQAQPAAIAPATGNVDDAVNAILASISDDQSLFAEAEKDAALIDADSQAISDFGQSYNEKDI